jgi:hypothetical protein
MPIQISAGELLPGQVAILPAEVSPRRIESVTPSWGAVILELDGGERTTLWRTARALVLPPELFPSLPPPA